MWAYERDGERGRLSVQRMRSSGIAVLLVLASQPRPASGACNLIPGTVRSYDGALAATNRPFAAPGEPCSRKARMGANPPRCYR